MGIVTALVVMHFATAARTMLMYAHKNITVRMARRDVGHCEEVVGIVIRSGNIRTMIKYFQAYHISPECFILNISFEYSGVFICIFYMTS